MESKKVFIYANDTEMSRKLKNYSAKKLVKSGLRLRAAGSRYRIDHLYRRSGACCAASEAVIFRRFRSSVSTSDIWDFSRS